MPIDALSAISFIWELSSQLFKYRDKIMSQKPEDQFLTYDSLKLKDFYVSEHTYEFVPYKLVYNFIDHLEKPSFDEGLVNISWSEEKFKLDNGKAEWDNTSRQAFEALKATGRISRAPELLSRIANAFIDDSGKLNLFINKADYFDQARTNLVLDYPNKGKQELISLRKQLLTQYPYQLPDWNDERLGNTMGISCLLFYQQDGNWMPYMVRREKKVAVHPGGIQSTASGAAKWPDKIDANRPFTAFFIDHMYNELYEEAGLTKEDVNHFVPVAFCREFLRGGKPQLFFIGTTSLNCQALIEKRQKARKLIEAHGGWKEITQDSMLKKAQLIIEKDTELELLKFKLSHEPFILTLLAKQYFSKYGSFISQQGS